MLPQGTRYNPLQGGATSQFVPGTQAASGAPSTQWRALNPTNLQGSLSVGQQGGGNVNGASTTRYDEGADADAASRAAMLFGIDAGLSAANDGLGRLDRQAGIGYGNIDRQYQDATGRLRGQRMRAEGDYKQNMTDQLNTYQSARNQNNQQAASWLQGARGTLGAAGAGGGSKARFTLPFEAQKMASGENAVDQSANTRNVSALTQNWQQAEDEFTNSGRDLDYQREQGVNDYRGKIEGQRADLLSTIASLTGRRSLATGGSLEQARSASQPYTSRIPAILDQIDSLAATPNIRERQVTVGRPDLQAYDFARPEQAPVAQQDPTLQGRNPLLALFGLQDDRQLM